MAWPLKRNKQAVMEFSVDYLEEQHFAVRQTMIKKPFAQYQRAQVATKKIAFW
jgi:hypothetical protein